MIDSLSAMVITGGAVVDTPHWQCGKHHTAPQCAQPRHAGTPHAGGTVGVPNCRARDPTPQDSGFESNKAPGSNPESPPALFFVLFLSSDGRSGALSGELQTNHKNATPVANFRRRLQNFRRGGLW